jgi:hypothetical protein
LFFPLITLSFADSQLHNRLLKLLHKRTMITLPSPCFQICTVSSQKHKILVSVFSLSRASAVCVCVRVSLSLSLSIRLSLLRQLFGRQGCQGGSRTVTFLTALFFFLKLRPFQIGVTFGTKEPRHVAINDCLIRMKLQDPTNHNAGNES